MIKIFSHIARWPTWWLILGLSVLITACDDPAHQPIVNIQNRLPDLRFELQAEGGRTVTQQDVRGKITLVFFGYANCPDICPTTMARLAQLSDELGQQAEQVRVLFISVDPHRDTPEMLGHYVRAFDNPFALGLSGNPDEIERIARRYRVSFQILEPEDPENPNYDVSHSKGVFVFDSDGKVQYLVPDLEAPGAASSLGDTVRAMLAQV